MPDLVEVPVDPATVVAGEGSTELVWSTEVGSGGADDSFPVSTFFRPQLTLVGYAFLGSYVFALLHVLRGYQRRDLHPKAYNTVTVRILAAYALALVVGVAYDGPAAEVTMFFVGFMPQSALVWLKEKLSVSDGVWGVVPLHEPAPLTDLEGIDLYDRTRLDEEGIANIHNLAHADIVELMSSTRISAAQLVDWTDQAILYLRVGGDAMARQQKGSPAAAEGSTVGEGGGGSGSEPFHPPDVRRNLCHLRSYGIRTASDLVQAYEQALRRGRDRAGRELGDAAPARCVAEYEAAEVDALRAALDLPDAPQRAGVRTIQTIIDTLPDEEWFVQVRNWRNPEFGAVDAWYSYLDGHDWNLTRSTQVPDRVTQAKLPLSSVALVAAAGVRQRARAPRGGRRLVGRACGSGGRRRQCRGVVQRGPHGGRRRSRRDGRGAGRARRSGDVGDRWAGRRGRRSDRRPDRTGGAVAAGDDGTRRLGAVAGRRRARVVHDRQSSGAGTDSSSARSAVPAASARIAAPSRAAAAR